VELNTQRLHTAWQQKVFSKLLGFQYKIIYQKGVENSAADALSRHPAPGAQIMAISSVVPQWLLSITESYAADEKAQQLLQQLTTTGDPAGNYTLHQGVIRYKGKIWLSSKTAMQHKIFTSLHESAIGVHSGFPVTYARIKQLFYWPGMKLMIKNWFQSCGICSQAKPDKATYPGLLHPLPIPDHAWQTISMDFIEGLPRSKGFNCILVVVDNFSRYAHFLPLSHPFSALTVAHAFMDNIYKLHGTLTSIISDRDRIFTSNVRPGATGLGTLRSLRD
jgi:hypothetical protein